MVSRTYNYPPPPSHPHEGARYLSSRLCAPYSYSERRYLPSHDARAITMAEPQSDDNTPPRKRIAVAVSPHPGPDPGPSPSSSSCPLPSPCSLPCLGLKQGCPWNCGSCPWWAGLILNRSFVLVVPKQKQKRSHTYVASRNPCTKRQRKMVTTHMIC